MIVLLIAPLLGGCEAFERGLGANTNILARAWENELTVDEAVELLADNEAQLPNQPEVVEALADLWIDYTLLATAANTEGGIQELDR